MDLGFPSGSPFLLLNAFITLSAAIVSFLVSVRLLKRENKDWESFSYGLVWVMAVPIWFFISLGIFFLYCGLEFYFYAFESLVRVFVPLQLAFSVFYILTKLFGRRKFNLFVTAVYFPATLIYLVSFLQNGLEKTQGLYGIDTKLQVQTFYLFAAVFALPFLLCFYRLFLGVFKYLVSKKKQDLKEIYPLVPLIIYGLVGLGDEAFVMHADWRFMAMRLVLVVSASMAYFAYTSKEIDKISIAEHPSENKLEKSTP